MHESSDTRHAKTIVATSSSRPSHSISVDSIEKPKQLNGCRMLYADILKIFERRLTLTGEEPISEAIAQLAHVDVITDKNAHDFHTWIRNGTVFFRIVHSEGSA